MTPSDDQAGRSAPTRRGLTEGELSMLGHLGSVVESPREAKRLLNLYRTCPRIARFSFVLSPLSANVSPRKPVS